MVGSAGSEGIGIVIGGMVNDSPGNEMSGIDTESEIVGSAGRLGTGIVIGGIVNARPGKDTSGMSIDSEIVGSAGSDGIGIVIGGITKERNEQALTCCYRATLTLVLATPAGPEVPHRTGLVAFAPSDTEPALSAAALPMIATFPELSI